jgi:hypothetical protein
MAQRTGNSTGPSFSWHWGKINTLVKMQILLSFTHTNRVFQSFVFRIYSLVRTLFSHLTLSKWPCSQIPSAIAIIPIEMNTIGGQKCGAIKDFKALVYYVYL